MDDSDLEICASYSTSNHLEYNIQRMPTDIFFHTLVLDVENILKKKKARRKETPKKKIGFQYHDQQRRRFQYNKKTKKKNQSRTWAFFYYYYKETWIHILNFCRLLPEFILWSLHEIMFHWKDLKPQVDFETQFLHQQQRYHTWTSWSEKWSGMICLSYSLFIIEKCIINPIR